MSSAICFNLDQAKILSSGNELVSNTSLIAQNITISVLLIRENLMVLVSADPKTDCTI